MKVNPSATLRIDSEQSRTVNILGVKVNDVGIEEALEIVHGWLGKKEKKYIVTPNPEIIVAAQSDKQYQTILNNADLSIPDGIGLKLSGKIKNHIPGVDFMEELIKHSIDWGSTVGFLGGATGVAEKCAECLLKKYPKLKIVFAESGGEVDGEGRLLGVLSRKTLPAPQSVSALTEIPSLQVPSSAPPPAIPKLDLLFVAFGPPKQEKWIAKNLKTLDVKVTMGVGGAFDYISGKVPRAPVFIRKIGFEWLFRLIVQPWRIKRQISLIKYLFMLLLKV